MKILWSVLLLAMSASGEAQTRPTPGAGDPRLQTAVYDPDQVLLLQVAAGYQLTLILNPDETVETVAMGDSAGWEISPSNRGDTLFIKVDGSARQTNLSVITSARNYVFELVPDNGSSPDTPYRVQLLYPQIVEATPVATATSAGSYRFSGSKSIRPVAMSDDGSKTYMEWAPEQSLPAVFAIDDTGAEALVDGHMRDGRYTVDAVRDRFIFRLDRQTARASRTQRRD